MNKDRNTRMETQAAGYYVIVNVTVTVCAAPTEGLIATVAV